MPLQCTPPRRRLRAPCRVLRGALADAAAAPTRNCCVRLRRCRCQGLVTNDVHLLSPNAASGDDSDERLEACQYNSLLSPKGRVLYEMILWAGHAIDAPDAEQCLWLECDAEMIPALQKHLTKCARVTARHAPPPLRSMPVPSPPPPPPPP